MSIKISTKTPQMTSQFRVCPIPYRLDTYTGCTFGCKYCFARDIIQNVRRVGKKAGVEASFSYLVGMDVEKFRRWVNKTLTQETDKIEKIAFQERLPVKIGGIADPFPYIEKQEKITYNVLKILDEIDYPVQISTKNPSILADYVDDFTVDNHRPNWALSVTIITPDENLRKFIEPCAPSIDNRFNAIKKLTEKGVKTLVRIQPVIYPYIMTNMEELINKIHDSGAYGVIMEGLKVRIVMDKFEQEVYRQFSEYIGYDIRQWYKDNGVRTKSDYEIKKEDKIRYINYAKELCSNLNMKVFAGDNDCREHGCSGECCGTENLRDHKTIYQSEKLLNCKAKFGRNKTQQDKFIKDLIENK